MQVRVLAQRGERCCIDFCACLALEDGYADQMTNRFRYLETPHIDSFLEWLFLWHLGSLQSLERLRS